MTAPRHVHQGAFSRASIAADRARFEAAHSKPVRPQYELRQAGHETLSLDLEEVCQRIERDDQKELLALARGEEMCATDGWNPIIYITRVS